MTEKYIKISMGKIQVPEDIALENGKKVQILLSGEVTKVEYPATQSEDEEIVYIVKGLVAYTINGEEVI